MKVVKTCPLGHVCEEARDNTIYRCNWYLNMHGKDSRTGERTDEWVCAIPMQNVQMVEFSRNMIEQAASIQSLRNEVIKCQTETNRIMKEQLALEYNDGK